MMSWTARRLNWTRTALMARLAREGTAAQVPTVEEAERELSQEQKDTPTVITDGRWPRQLAGSPQTVRDQLEQMTKAARAVHHLEVVIGEQQSGRNSPRPPMSDSVTDLPVEPDPFPDRKAVRPNL
jgi:alkanesulfonate monooxygenase SsuD/methylene tetrahydromethanopterin reductase-like flavin-dependent oxidoreductase (luciferase family)